MRFVRHLSTVVAVLCVLAWMPWILGVPGQMGNDYARGWMIGLVAVLVYPIVILGIALLGVVLRAFGRTDPALPDALRGLALAAFFATQALAWSILL